MAAQKNLISLANVLLAVSVIANNHLSWLGIEDGSQLHRDLFFTFLFALFAVTRLLPKSEKRWINELVSGYLIGFALDIYLTRIHGHEEKHLGEIMTIAMPVFGQAWRMYRDKTSKYVTVSLLVFVIKKAGALLFWLISKLLFLVGKVFG